MKALRRRPAFWSRDAFVAFLSRSGRGAIAPLLLLALASCASEPVYAPTSTNAAPISPLPAEVSIVLPSELFVKVTAIATAATTLEDFKALGPIATANPDFAPGIAATAIQAILANPDNGASTQKISMIVQVVVAAVPSKVSEIVKACLQVVPHSNTATTQVRATATNAIRSSSK